MTTDVNRRAADNIRIISMAMVEKANSGHPGARWAEQISYTFFTVSS